MFLVIKLRPEIGEYEEDRKLIVLLHDEDGGEMARITGNLHVPAPKGGQIPEINAVLELKDIVFPKPGHYRFVVLVDKDHKGNLPIDLIEFVREEE
jgi:hypothetical protein